MGIADPLRSITDLVGSGFVPAARAAELEAVAARYAVSITPDMADLIDRDDSNDPIARQFVPDERELIVRQEESADPIGDDAHSPVKGIVHRYPDRVLLKPSHICPVYCRFCFRREKVGPGGEGGLTMAEMTAALSYIRTHPQIWEVVVTGGDPLLLSPRRVAAINQGLATADHVRVVRWHSRVPMVEPARVTDGLVEALRVPGRAVWVAIHANHPREFTAAAEAAIARLADAGFPLVSQSVLLKGVNDDVATLGALMRAFVENRIKPYYLHQGDLAPGTEHFRASPAAGRRLMRALRGRFSGLAQPTYVLDIPGGHGKVPIGPSYVDEAADGDGLFSVLDPNGRAHVYPPVADRPAET